MSNSIDTTGLSTWSELDRTWINYLTVGVWSLLFGGAPSSILREVGCKRFLLGDGDELTLLLSFVLSLLSAFTKEATEGLPLPSWLGRCCIILGLPCTVVMLVSQLKSLCYGRLLLSIATFTQDNSQHSPADSDTDIDESQHIFRWTRFGVPQDRNNDGRSKTRSEALTFTLCSQSSPCPLFVAKR